MAAVSERTIKTLVSRSLEKILVQSDQQQAQNIELQTAFEHFQEWIAEMIADGLNIGQVPVNMEDTIGSLNYNVGTYRGLVDNFAVVLATEYDRPINPTLATNADDSMRVIEKILVDIGPTPYGPRVPVGSGNSGDDDFVEHYYRAGVATTAYGDDIINVRESASTTAPRGQITGAQTGSSVFTATPIPSVFSSSLSVANGIVYTLSGGTVRRYSTSGSFIGSQFLNQAAFTSITTSANGDLIGLTSTNILVRLSIAPPHATTATIADISSDGALGNSADIVEGANGDIWIVTNTDNTIRKYSSAGVRDTSATINITPQGENPTSITYVEGSLWIVQLNSGVVNRYSTVSFTGNSFPSRESTTFGLAWDGNNFWEGGAQTGSVYSRPGVRTVSAIDGGS